MTRIRWQLAVFCLVHILIFLILFPNKIYGEQYPAAPLYHFFASRVLDGQQVYRDFQMEYPPLSLLFFLLPRLVTGDVNTYTTLFYVELLLFDLLGLFIIWAMSPRLGQPPWKALSIYTIAMLATGPITITRYDLIPGIMVLVALHAFFRGWHKTAWAVLALGTMTKLFPAFIAPIFFISYLRHDRRQIIPSVVTFAAVTVAIAVPFLLLSPDGFIKMLNYHSGRGLQIESLYASFLLVMGALRLVPVRLEFSFGSWNMSGAAADTLARVSIPIMIFSLLAVYAFFYISTTRRTQPADGKRWEEVTATDRIMDYSFAAVLVATITSKILSPQYIVWLLPFVPLVTGPRRFLTWELFVVAALLTYYIFPSHYLNLLYLQSSPIYVLFIRNIILTLIATVLVVESGWLSWLGRLLRRKNGAVVMR